ncbi:acyl carrier protein [Azoarcus taiwanensis]|uniref:Acyl carrier protein n=1 Tax=Azoarcus taiwanensis TaxID=666964 RepID=A0A972JB86_9RHOO|nr:acyl carrier protein [Azoarcus taiwanensis]NMG03848.1 acyl carrier protein [Azoarcus taiwanensis]
MTDQDLLDQLRAILVENFEIDADAVTPDAHLYETLGLDSIDAVDLAIKIQQLTGKRIKAEDFKHVRTVGDVLSTARELMTA